MISKSRFECLQCGLGDDKALVGNARCLKFCRSDKLTVMFADCKREEQSVYHAVLDIVRAGVESDCTMSSVQYLSLE